LYFTDPTNADTDGDGTDDGLDGTPAGDVTTEIDPEAPLPTEDFVVAYFTPDGGFFDPAKVAGDALISVTFNSDVDDTTVTGSNLTLFDMTSSSAVSYSLGTAPNPRTLVLEPTSALTSGHTYRI